MLLLITFIYHIQFVLRHVQLLILAYTDQMTKVMVYVGIKKQEEEKCMQVCKRKCREKITLEFSFMDK